jgi:PKD repeat protein
MRQFYFLACVWAFAAQLHAQDQYKVYLKSGVLAPSANFTEVSLQRPSIDAQEFINGAYYLRLLQFEQVLTESQKAALEAQGLVFTGYIDFASYITLIPRDFDLVALAKFQTRSILPFDPNWKIQDQVLYPDGNPWAIDGNLIDVRMHYLPKADKTLLAMKLANLPGVQQFRSEGDYFQAWIPRDLVYTLAQMPEIIYLELQAEPGQPEDTGGRSMHRSGLLDTQVGGGLNLTGNGIGVQVRDDGALGPHIDFQGRLNNLSSNFGDTHGDGVGGIIGSAGNLNPDNRGMAAGSTVFATNYQSTFTDNTLDLHLQQGVMITNSSYSDGCNNGYTTSTVNVDRMLFQNPSLMHVFSAGNNNPASCGYGAGTTFGNITGGHKQGKNCIATANLDVNGVIATSSSRGPAKDGRLKPDISAHGAGQISNAENNTYQSFGGTSAAAPGIAGCMAQLYEGYKLLNGGSTPEAALVKAAMLNTTNDLGRVGPDYVFGWGHVNAFRAYNLLAENRYNSSTISQGETKTQTITVPANTAEVRVMVYWAEPAAALNAQKALINDLDIRLLDGNGQASLPWKLNTAPDSALLSQPAGKGRDSLNNVEQVSILSPNQTTYTLEIKGFSVPSGPQKYWAVVEYRLNEIKLVYPNGGEAMVPGTTARIHWDAPATTGTVNLQYSTNGGTSWTNITTNLAATTRQYNWTVPAVSSGRVKVRVVKGSLTDDSDADCTITSAVTGFAVNRFCPTEAEVTWTANPQAASYEVFKLGAKYMKSVGTTSSTSLVFPHNYNPSQPLWVSIRPILADGGKGRRLNAISQVDLKSCSNVIDLSQNQILSPASATIRGCGAFDLPISVRIKNESIQTLNGATAHYQLDAGPVVSEALATINPSALLVHTFAQTKMFNANGNFKLKTWVTHPDDQIRFNDTLTRQFAVVVATASGPVTNDFSNGLLPTGWVLENPDTNLTWELNAQGLQINGQGGFSAKMNFFDYDGSGQIDRLYLPPVALNATGSPKLAFSRAHANFNAQYEDELQIEVYRDCGVTGVPEVVWSRKGALLATVPASTSEFLPNSASQWVADTVDLSAYLGDTVIISFTTINDFGNNLYIDNINVDAGAGGAPPVAQFTITQPSPCANAPITLLATTGANNNTTYSWSVNGVPLFTGAGPHTYTGTSASVPVQLTATNPFGSTNSNQTVFFQLLPTASFVTNTNQFTAFFTNQSANYASVQWNFGDGATSTALNPSHVYTQNGVYAMVLTVTGPCGTVNFQQTVEISVGQPPSAAIALGSPTVCVGAPLALSASNQAQGTSYAWSFSGGTNTPNGTSGGAISPVFQQAGTFQITLTATNSFGTASDQVSVQVLPNSSAAFAVGVNQNVVTFTNQSQNATSYFWDFGDGTTSTDANPTHTYQNNQNYTVTLRATGSCGFQVSTQTVTIAVLSPPTLAYSVSRDTACVWDNILFNGTPSANAPATISWNFGPGALPQTTATGAGTQTVWWDVPGQYTVTIIASNAAGADTVRREITILPPPTSDFISSVTGFTATFTQLAQNANAYSWNFGDGSTSTDANPVHVYATSGVFQATLTVTGTCGTNTTTFPVVIENQSPPTVTAVANVGSVCQNIPFEVTATATNANEVQWYIGQISGVPVATGFGPLTLSTALTGNIPIYAVAVGSFGLDTAQLNMTVQEVPNATTSVTIVQNTATFTAVPNSATAAFFWRFGDGSPQTSVLNPTHTYAQNGTYNATFHTVGLCGAPVFTVTVVIAVQPPTAAISLTGTTDTVCTNAQIQVQGLTPPDVMIDSWSWNFGASASPATATGIGSHTVSYTTPGLKDIALIVSNIAGSQTITKQIYVQEPLVPSFTATTSLLTVSLQNNTIGATNLNWNFGDGNTSAEPNPVHTYAANGTYIITLSVNNACGLFITTDTVVVNSVSVQQPEAGLQVRLFPNPATDYVKLAFDQLVQGRVELFAADGRMVLEQKIGGSELYLPVAALARGNYSVRVKTDTGIWIGRIVLQ